MSDAPLAARWSGHFRRTTESWPHRAPHLRALLEALAAEPVTPQAVRALQAALTADQSGIAPDPDAPARHARVLARALRRMRQVLLLALMERDARGAADLPEVCLAMSAFADGAVQAALDAAHGELAQRHGAPLDAAGRAQPLLAVGMGKLGAHELNVSSDIDLVFVAREQGTTAGNAEGRHAIAATDYFTRLAQRATQLLADTTEDGFVFRVDTRLRPDGDSGPLVCTLPMLETYFYRHGREWERFAWLKSRVIAAGGWGEPAGAALAAARDDIDALAQIVQPFVFRRYLDFGAFDALRALHDLIRAEARKREARRGGAIDVKLGRGGIREVEFIAQLFQIVRGGRDAALRERATLPTLAAIAERALLPAEDCAALAGAYGWLRRVEHALQYRDDAQTHLLPESEAARAETAGLLGVEPDEMLRRLQQARDHVERCFDTLLAKPAEGSEVSEAALDAAGTAAVPAPRPLSADVTTAARVAVAAASPAGAAHDRSQLSLSEVHEAAAVCHVDESDDAADAAGPVDLADPDEAADPPDPAADLSGAPGDRSLSQRVAALRATARWRDARAETQATVERLLARAARATAGWPHAERDRARLRVIDLLDRVLGRPGYLLLLDRYPHAFAHLLRMLGQAAWAADYLMRHPIVLDELLDGQIMAPTDWGAWAADVQAQLDRLADGASFDVERQMDLLREAHHAQVFRLLAQDLDGRLSVEALSDQLSELADRVLDLSIATLWPQIRGRHRERPAFAVIAYGKLGGKELGYASDLDLVYVYEDADPAAPEAYARLAQRLAGWLSTTTAAGALFEIDTRLRPNGNAGLLVSTLPAFEHYQRAQAWIWEHQALTRARFAAGDAAIGARFEAIRRAVLALPRAPQPLAAEVLAMRRRMHAGHPNSSGEFDLKHDVGGMVDIEFAVQFLVLAHASAQPELLDNVGNIALLRRAAMAGLIEPQLASRCAEAYRRYRRLQHALRLNAARFVRVPPAQVAAEREAVQSLWCALFGERA